MKSKIYLFTWLLSLVLAMVSCTGKTSEEVASTLDYAEQKAAAGDYAGSLALCDEVTQSKDTLSFTWRDYCRAAVIYADAYDHDVETDASMASAARCLERARRMQPDSVTAFLVALGPDHGARVNTVVQTLDALYTDHSTLGDHEEEGYIHHEDGEHEHLHEND